MCVGWSAMDQSDEFFMCAYERLYVRFVCCCRSPYGDGIDEMWVSMSMV